jgi:hypothetical protein
MSRTGFKIYWWRMQVEPLPNKFEALSSIPSTSQKENPLVVGTGNGRNKEEIWSYTKNLGAEN